MSAVHICCIPLSASPPVLPPLSADCTPNFYPRPHLRPAHFAPFPANCLRPTSIRRLLCLVLLLHCSSCSAVSPKEALPRTIKADCISRLEGQPLPSPRHFTTQQNSQSRLSHRVPLLCVVRRQLRDTPELLGHPIARAGRPAIRRIDDLFPATILLPKRPTCGRAGPLSLISGTTSARTKDK